MGVQDKLRGYFSDENSPELKRKKYSKLLISFFIAMLACTVISRAADSITVARVETDMAKGGTLVHRASAEGTLKALDQIYVQGEKGLFVQKIHIAEGEHVEKGAVLFTMDNEQVKEQLDIVNSEISILELSIQKLKVDNGSEEQTAVSKAEQKLARAVADDEFNTMINGGKQMQVDSRAIEDAQTELNQAKMELEEYNENFRMDIEIQSIQLRAKEIIRSKLQKIYTSRGTVLAETSGTIGKIFAEQGKETAEEALCTIIPINSGYIVETELDSDMARYMKIGDEITVSVTGKVAPIKGVVIKSLNVTGEKTSLTANIPPENIVDNGTFATVEHEKITDGYEAIIPISALRGTEGNYYVLTVQETNTILGAERIAVETIVKVIDKDNKSAAIEEGIDGDIISNSNKPIKAGDRVREAML